MEEYWNEDFQYIGLAGSVSLSLLTQEMTNTTTTNNNTVLLIIDQFIVWYINQSKDKWETMAESFWLGLSCVPFQFNLWNI